MLKVLHLIQGYGGGISSLVKNLILSSDKTRIRQDVMSFAYQNGESFVEELKNNGCGVYLMPRPRKVGYFAFRKYVLNVMREGEYDVVHCHTDGWRSTIFKKLAYKSGVRLFCIHAHRTTNNPGVIQNNILYVKFNQKISKKNADIRFACGEEAAKFIYGDNRNTITVPNAISLERCSNATKFDKNILRRELDIKEEECVLLHAGRFVPQKNHIFMIELAEILKHKGISFKLLLAGTGDLQPKIQKLVKKKHLEKQVLFLGRRDDVYELMAISDYMLLPSTSEGLPTVAIEAQAMGLKSLVSDTVTQECDLGLGLITFLPIRDAIDLWIENICSERTKVELSRDLIEKALNQRYYTASGSSKRYLGVLNEALRR